MNPQAEIPSTYSGGCSCGAVRYLCNGAPARMVNCHCRECQRAGGSGYAPSVILQKHHFRITRGRPRYHEVKADSGHLVRRAFCKVCGSPLFADSSGYPDFVALRAGSLDDPGWFAAAADVWVETAQPWVVMSPDTDKITGTQARR